MDNQNNGHVSEVSSPADAIPQNAAGLVNDASQSIAEVRRTLRQNATAAKEKASDSLLTAAESIRGEALKSGNDEMIRQSHVIARSMEKAALYLDSRTIDQLGEDATKVVQENVWPSLGIVFIVGLLLGILFGGHRD